MSNHAFIDLWQIPMHVHMSKCLYVHVQFIYTYPYFLLIDTL